MKKIIKWIVLNKILFLPIQHVYLLVSIIIKTKKESTVEKSKLSNLISSITKNSRKALSNLEYRILSATVEKIERITGDIAEVGVYRGGSAKIILETTAKQVHLFDTFEGLPETSNMDNINQFKKGEYSASYNDVKNYLKQYTNVHFYKGLFSNTATPVKDKKFSFVHLDVDIYESTLKSLEFFYPRMNRGG